MRLTKNLFRLFLLITISVSVLSCKKNSGSDDPVTPPANGTNFPAPIANIVSQSMIDSLRARGVAIYDGTTPPIVNGIYLMKPDSCIYDNSAGNYAGTLFADYKFNFTSQNNTAFTISVAQKNTGTGTLSSTPVSTYISGSGNNFSIFLLRTSTPSGITLQQFNVLSGTLTATGIQNLQNSLYIRSKGADPNHVVADAGTIRVFVTGAPGLAGTSGSFRKVRREENR